MEQKKILITEDEEPISQLLSYTLNKEGFVTQVAKRPGMSLISGQL